MIKNLTITYDEWSPKALAECYELKLIGGYCIVLFVVGIIANPLLIWIILKNKTLINSVNIVILSLTILNTIGLLAELPLVTLSAIMCKFTLGKFGCYLEAFLLFFIGSTTIYILTFISCVRYFQIRNMELPKKNYSFTVKGIFLCASVGLLWSLMPIFGWSEYSLEGAMISCSIEWNKRTFGVTSFIIVFAILIYLVPLCILLYTSIEILRIVCNETSLF